jgi:23S rRNA maturation mini-RNase III
MTDENVMSLTHIFVHVTAETQSKMFRNLLSSEKIQLTKEEQTIISRGRNAGSSSGGRKRGPKRLYATNNGKKSEAGGPEVYQDSTAMEALIGYAYLTDKERCTELIKYFADELDMMDDEENVAR